MNEREKATLVADLMLDEGTGPMRRGRLLAYQDTMGVWTIGFGRNLQDRGISMQEAHDLLNHDVEDVLEEMARAFPWASTMNSVRQRVLANMLFNLGLAKLSGFVHTLAAMEAGRYEDAAAGMLSSKWARQVGKRADRLAREMETGRDA